MKATSDQLPVFRYRVIKRTIDLLLASVGLLFVVPLGVLVALLVLHSSPGPIFYRESRLGQYGKPFRIWKFRTMYTGEEQQRRLQQIEHTAMDLRSTHKCSDDPRVTPIGRVFRRWSIDELPQIINVLKGEMSLIGPRPIVNAERKLYGKVFDYYCMVQPGLSGLWQVSGRSNLTYEERVQIDYRYVKGWSLAQDLVIFAKTFYVVLTAHGAY